MTIFQCKNKNIVMAVLSVRGKLESIIISGSFEGKKSSKLDKTSTYLVKYPHF